MNDDDSKSRGISPVINQDQKMTRSKKNPTRITTWRDFKDKGCKMGLEPTTPGTTIRCSNQLSYMHHV